MVPSRAVPFANRHKAIGSGQLILLPYGLGVPVGYAVGTVSALLFGDALLDGPAGELHLVVQLQLAQRVLHVVLHRPV